MATLIRALPIHYYHHPVVDLHQVAQDCPYEDCVIVLAEDEQENDVVVMERVDLLHQCTLVE